MIETFEEVPPHTWVAPVLAVLGKRELLERFGGVLVGRPAARSHLEDRPPAEREAYRADQRGAIRTVLERYAPDAPVVFDLDFGYTWPTPPVPTGRRVEIDPATETIRFG